MIFVFSIPISKKLVEEFEQEIYSDYKYNITSIDTRNNKYEDFLLYDQNNTNKIYTIFDYTEITFKSLSISSFGILSNDIRCFLLLQERVSIDDDNFLYGLYEYVMKRFYLWLKYSSLNVEIDREKILVIPDVLREDHRDFRYIAHLWMIDLYSVDKKQIVVFLEFLIYFEGLVNSRKMYVVSKFSEQTNLHLYIDIIEKLIKKIRKSIEIILQNKDKEFENICRLRELL